LNPDAEPIDYFMKFLPQAFFEKLAIETNRYATQKGPDPRWHQTNADEMRAYVSIVRVCSDSNPPKSDKLTAITAG